MGQPGLWSRKRRPCRCAGAAATSPRIDLLPPVCKPALLVPFVIAGCVPLAGATVAALSVSGAFFDPFLATFVFLFHGIGGKSFLWLYWVGPAFGAVLAPLFFLLMAPHEFIVIDRRGKPKGHPWFLQYHSIRVWKVRACAEPPSLPSTSFPDPYSSPNPTPTPVRPGASRSPSCCGPVSLCACVCGWRFLWLWGGCVCNALATSPDCGACLRQGFSELVGTLILTMTAITGQFGGGVCAGGKAHHVAPRPLVGLAANVCLRDVCGLMRPFWPGFALLGLIYMANHLTMAQVGACASGIARLFL